jgi:hypothetical protein
MALLWIRRRAVPERTHVVVCGFLVNLAEPQVGGDAAHLAHRLAVSSASPTDDRCDLAGHIRSQETSLTADVVSTTLPDTAIETI